MDNSSIIGFSGAAGFSTGFAATKLGKIGIVAIGSGFMFVQGLSQMGYVTVNWDKAEHDFNKFLGDYEPKLSDIVANNIPLPCVAAFSTGMILGFRMAR